MSRQGHLIAVLEVFLIGCAVLLVVGGSGVRAEASQEEQGHTETTEQQGRSPEAASEEGRCGGTRRELRFQTWFYVTNDVPGCPKGGVLTGTDGPDMPPDRAGLDGKDGDDKIRGLGGSDEIYGSSGSDVVYGGPGPDFVFSGVLNGGVDEENNDDVLYGGDDSDDLYAGNGEDVLYGGDGNDHLDAVDIGMGKTAPRDGGRDKLICGGGWDKYVADPNDYVDGSCEKGQFWEDGKLVGTGGPPLILLAGVALLLSSSGLMMGRYVIRRAS